MTKHQVATFGTLLIVGAALGAFGATIMLQPARAQSSAIPQNGRWIITYPSMGSDETFLIGTATGRT